MKENNDWTRLSSIEYVNPHLGKIIFYGDYWEAFTRFDRDNLSKRFATLKDAINWMDNLGG
jgi:hypothetical protein